MCTQTHTHTHTRMHTHKQLSFRFTFSGTFYLRYLDSNIAFIILTQLKLLISKLKIMAKQHIYYKIFSSNKYCKSSHKKQCLT